MILLIPAAARPPAPVAGDLYVDADRRMLVAFDGSRDVDVRALSDAEIAALDVARLAFWKTGEISNGKPVSKPEPNDR